MDQAPSAMAVDTAAKAQEFAHRVVEFADVAACLKFFDEKTIDFDRPNATGATVLMTVVARGRVDLVGHVMDRTTNITATTIPNGTTVLHLAAMASNPQVIKELAGTDERKAKLRAIANVCNRNGDTPLMMASVVKNAIAAKLLVEYLDASTTSKNATGMTALMCASRLRDEREGPLMANESASIVSLLLAYGADANAAEYAGRQTALHFALLTNNLMVVEQLLTIININLTARNKAGHSPLELARKLKLDGLIDAAVESQWQVVEEEAQLLSEQVAQELEIVVESSTIEGSKKPHKKKHKKKVGGHKKEPTDKIAQAHDDEASPDEAEATAAIEEQIAPVQPDESVAVTVMDESADTGDWVTASKKKPKQKDSISADPEPATTTKNSIISSTANHNHKSKAKAKSEADKKSVTKAATVGSKSKALPNSLQQAHMAPPPAAFVPAPSKPAPWAPAPAVTSANLKATSSPSPSIAAHVAPTGSVSLLSRLQDVPVSTEERMAYDDMNAVFHRMYPIAAEMDIPVETFIAGADTRDTRELLDGLSVSQIEMLQEAHLQAYHYLNERKIEMARILEAERLEAQLQLRRHLFEMQ